VARLNDLDIGMSKDFELLQDGEAAPGAPKA